MTTFLNLSSLILGLIAWGVALWGVIRREPRLSSFFLCALPLLLELYEVGNRVKMGDLSAVMDTIRAVNIAGTVLVVGTLILNLLAYVRKRKK